ncbi:hypothetical protein [Streptomyces sp. enrichment culture]|uniref:hypothetical protein n=1 Tax=Streptomyces sp. enrichment culture TaxID=1795815 RepID=UPI003F556702
MTAHDDRGPVSVPAPAEDDYSATVLASHWIQGPEPGETATVRETGTFPGPPADAPVADRVEGTVLRFGPGVTAAVAERNRHRSAAVPPTAARTLPPGPASPAPVRRRARRHALPALVLLCVLAFLAWQRLGSSVEVRSVTVAARPSVLGCGATAEIVARLTTDGRPGTISYRWIRSDGTASQVLRERVTEGQRTATLRLRWTFEGTGRVEGRADLRLLAPTSRTATARLVYDCR